MDPLVVAVEMGYGHLRPAHTLAAAFGVGLSRADGPPLAGAVETRVWQATRAAYNLASRVSQVPAFGLPFRVGLDRLTAIPADLDGVDPAPDGAARLATLAARAGLGAGVLARLRATGAPLVSTFYLPALAASAAGLPAWCLVTDTDCARAWVPADARAGHVRYFAPTPRVARRLVSYGVPAARVRTTGFPLPAAHTDGPAAEARRRARVERLRGHGGPVRVVLSIGGAGAQGVLVRHALPSLEPLLRDGRVHATFAVGTHLPLARALTDATRSVAEHVSILSAGRVEDYLGPFDDALAEADALWTKPSELVFYAAAGLPLLLAPPIGAQEHANLAWILDAGAGRPAPADRPFGDTLAHAIADGSLAAAAEAAWEHLPREGTRRIVEAVRAGFDG